MADSERTTEREEGEERERHMDLEVSGPVATIVVTGLDRLD